MRSGRRPVPEGGRSLPAAQTTDASDSRAELPHYPATLTANASYTAAELAPYPAIQTTDPSYTNPTRSRPNSATTPGAPGPMRM